MEVSVFMALRAIRLRVFPLQWKFRCLVIESRSRLAVLPARSVVACFTRPAKVCVLKRAAMRIGVAVLATAKCQTLEVREYLPFRRWRRSAMTLLASQRLMLSRERECGFRMTEPRRRFPSVLGMAAHALLAQLPCMGILMAVRTFPAQSQEAPVWILQLNLRARWGGNVFECMATGAALFPMLPLKTESCLRGVVERLAVQLHQRELCAVVLHVTAHTIRFTRRRFIGFPVESASSLNSFLNLGVAFQTFEAAGAGAEIMTRGALRQAVPLLMSR